jgi:hypothetical protein
MVEEYRKPNQKIPDQEWQYEPPRNRGYRFLIAKIVVHGDQGTKPG